MTISYRDAFGLYWPEWDEKADRNYQYIIQNLPTMELALERCQKHLVCVQAGGHVGLWPMKLADYFAEVHTFEPEPDLFNCLVQNASQRAIKPTYGALGESAGTAALKRSTSSGSNRLDPDGEIHVPVITIDSLALQNCDAILLDIEGHELQALRGAEQTIRKYKPVIQVEELDDGQQVASFLKGLGYQAHPEKQGKDRVYLPAC